MVRSQVQKERAQDKRLRVKYGITLADRQERERQQEGKCKICGGALNAYGHGSVDHFHFFILVNRADEMDSDILGCKWKAQGFDERGKVICARYGGTKTEAKQSVKEIMLPWSVRGLLCFKCNRGLGSIEKFFDAARHPENLLPVIEYLKARL